MFGATPASTMNFLNKKSIPMLDPTAATPVRIGNIKFKFCKNSAEKIPNHAKANGRKITTVCATFIINLSDSSLFFSDNQLPTIIISTTIPIWIAAIVPYKVNDEPPLLAIDYSRDTK